MEQYRTSANTSQAGKINRIYKRLVEDLLPNGSVILDYGCGKYDDNKHYAESNGYEWKGYDPYNRSEIENNNTLDRFDSEYPDVIVCSNVLNVLDSDEAMNNVMKELSTMTGGICKTFITIFEKDGDGIGKESKCDCWQRNEKTAAYIPRLKKYFKNVSKLKGESNIIICTN